MRVTFLNCMMGCMVFLVVLCTLYIGVMLAKEQNLEMGKYCIKHPLDNITGELSATCFEINCTNNVSDWWMQEQYGNETCEVEWR